MGKFNILSLDGGGSWAYIQARVLGHLYPQFSNREILSKFDLVAANSGGSLCLAAMLAFPDEKPSFAADLFADDKKRATIFSRIKGFQKIPQFLGGQFVARYYAKKKYQGIKEVLGPPADYLLKDIGVKIGLPNLQVLVCNYNYYTQRAVIFRSIKKGDTGNVNLKITLAMAIHGSSNAPIFYFDEPAQLPIGDKGEIGYYWDGAVGGNNNPTLVALTEAISMGIPLEDIGLFSIGTATVRRPVHKIDPLPTETDGLKEKFTSSNTIADTIKLATAILQDPPDSASIYAHTFLKSEGLRNGVDRLVRINPFLTPQLVNKVLWAIPDKIKAQGGDAIQTFKQSLELDMDAVAPEDFKVVKWVTDQYLANNLKNQPIIANSDFTCRIGDEDFPKAEAHWHQLMGTSSTNPLV